MNTKLLTMILLSALLSSGICALFTGSNAAGDESFKIENSEGDLIEFSQPADHVVLLGYGYTLSVIELGSKDKIVGVDKYTASYLQENSVTDVNDLGNFYNADGCVQIATGIIQLAEEGKFNYETDWIVAPNYSYITKEGGLKDILDENIMKISDNYNMITLASSATTYDQVIDIVGSLGKIVGADSSKSIEKMNLVKDKIMNVVKENDLSNAAMIQISSSGKVYNSSLIVSMVENILNGVNAGKNGTAASYSSDYSGILQMASKYDNTTIFTDQGYKNTDELKNAIGDYRIVPMTREWNNICPDIADGLWTVACAMYPDYFSGDVPTADGDSDNTLTYLIIGLSIAIILVIVAYIAIKKLK